MEEFEKIKDLITDSKIKEACSALRNYAISERTLNEILLQESKYYQLERDARNGVINADHGSKERSKIVHDMLQMTDNVKKESLGKTRKQSTDNKSVHDSPSTTPDVSKDRKDALYKAGNDYYDDAIYYFGHDKRRAHGACTNSATYYRYITLEYPDNPHGFLWLAATLKFLYLLNYNKHRTNEKYEEIASCIERGKRVDKDKLYHGAFDLILSDIEEFLSKEKIIRNIYLVCIPIILFSLADALYLKFNIFDFKSESPLTSTYIVGGLLLLVLYAFSLDEKQKKYIFNN